MLEFQTRGGAAERSKTKVWSPLTRTSKRKSRSGKKVIHEHKERVVHHHAKNHHHHITIQGGISGWWIAGIVVVFLLLGVGLFIWKPWENSEKAAGENGKVSNTNTDANPENNNGNESSETPKSCSTASKIIWSLLGLGSLYSIYFWVWPWVNREKKIIFTQKYDALENQDGQTQLASLRVYHPDGGFRDDYTFNGFSKSTNDDLTNDSSYRKEWFNNMDDLNNHDATSFVYRKKTKIKDGYCEYQLTHKNPFFGDTHTIEFGDSLRCGTKEEWKDWLKSDKSTKTITAPASEKLWNGEDRIFPNRDEVMKKSGWDWLKE